MSDTVARTDVFSFMELRAPHSVDQVTMRSRYIQDDYIGFRADMPARIDSDVQTSIVGKAVYEMVFCRQEPSDVGSILAALRNQLTPYRLLCPQNDRTAPPGSVQTSILALNDLETRPYVKGEGVFYLLPERLEHIKEFEWYLQLKAAHAVIESAQAKFDLKRLHSQIDEIFKSRPVRFSVFDDGIHSMTYRSAKRTIFDALYLLYIMRRRVPINLEFMIEGLRILHVMEALAIDSLVTAIQTGPISQADQVLRITLEELFPHLKGWNGSNLPSGFPLISDRVALEAYFTSTPVIHPLYARLNRYTTPFNDIKPIGVGDLKVVKQWLVGYVPGEIAHIENVLKGEIKDRTHRKLEKTEDSFSFSSSQKESTQKDTQSTERYELKNEAENVLKRDINVGANANLTYSSGPIVANVGGTFGFKRDETNQSKRSDTFWRETLKKAVEQVEKTSTEARTAVKLFETEETNKHAIENNKNGAQHITGIYRWLDKEYKAQLYNYDKRLMFEFVLPEPAAFFVESRIRANEALLQCPQPPAPPELNPVILDFKASDITAVKFNSLRDQYDLSEYSFPVINKWTDFVDTGTGKNFFSTTGLAHEGWQARSYVCRASVKDYRIVRFKATGYVYFWGRVGLPADHDPSHPKEINTLEIFVGGQKVVREVDNITERWWWNPGKEWVPDPATVPYDTDDVTLMVLALDGDSFDLSFHAELEYSPQLFSEWQSNVYNKISRIEEAVVKRKYQEELLVFNTKMANYRNALEELKGRVINDLLQGQSEAFNRDIIRTELKKHCLTMLTKEFDDNASDDVLASVDAMTEELPGKFDYRALKIDEDTTTNKTTCAYETFSPDIFYPSINLPNAKKKGRFVQFLEQAFEWQQLAYIFYPYFWARRVKWIDMMNRSDQADPNMSAFLQAGSARVLLAVTPAYEDAVLHYVATGEPWQGGPAPVIGDPLFIPLHEELRKRQDDRYKGVPEGEAWPFVLPTSLVYLDKEEDVTKLFPAPDTDI